MAKGVTDGKPGKRQVPIEEGLIRLPSSAREKASLLATKCKKCGEIYFPRKAACSACFSRDMEEITLSREGEVYSSTVITLAPPLYQGPVPYSIGVVKLPEGVLVPTVFAVSDFNEPLKIGARVGMVVEKFEEDAEGNEVMTYKFRPV